jgi:hypothetical protein
MMRLLSIDWDFFLPLPGHADPLFLMYDWGTGEHMPEPLQQVLWHTRAADFQRRQLPLPAVDGWQAFWRSFVFADAAEGMVADSHARIVPMLQNGPTGWRPDGRREWVRGWPYAEIVSYDAHHDCGYAHGKAQAAYLSRRLLHCTIDPDCSQWAAWAQLRGMSVHVVYPRWRSAKNNTDGPRGAAVQPASIVYDTGRSMRFGSELPFDGVFICRSSSWVPPWCDDAFTAFVAECPVPIVPMDACLSPRRFSQAYVDALVKAETEVLAAVAGKTT